MSSSQSVTQWLVQIKEGDPVAAQRLWQRYFGQLVQLARVRLRGTKKQVADEEDVALSALGSFFRGAAKKKFPDLHDRNSLWPLLVKITVCKAIKAVQREGRQKRGGQKVRGDSALGGPAKDSDAAAGWDQILDRGPRPDDVVLVSDECRRLLDKLDDDVLRHVALWKMEDFTNAEIAKKLGCVERTVDRKLGRIRKIWEEEVA